MKVIRFDISLFTCYRYWITVPVHSLWMKRMKWLFSLIINKVLSHTEMITWQMQLHWCLFFSDHLNPDFFFNYLWKIACKRVLDLNEMFLKAMKYAEKNALSTKTWSKSHLKISESFFQHAFEVRCILNTFESWHTVEEVNKSTCLRQ